MRDTLNLLFTFSWLCYGDEKTGDPTIRGVKKGDHKNHCYFLVASTFCLKVVC